MGSNTWDHKKARALQKQHGRTTQWVADFCGVSRGQMQHYLSGRRNPKAPVIKLLAQAFNTTEADLAGVSPAKRSPKREPVPA